MSDYYETLSIHYPQGESAVSFTWRYVFDHIAYDNQEHNQLWRVQYNDGSMHVETASSEFNEVLAQLIANLPPASVLSSNEYRSYDASTYDTLRQGYLPRMHSMIPVMRHRPYGTMSQRYATMDAQQQPALIGSAYNAEFRLISNMDADAAATYLRPEGHTKFVSVTLWRKGTALNQFRGPYSDTGTIG